jgi:hypothetical protein
MVGGQHLHVERAGGEFLHRLLGAGHAGGPVHVAIRAGHVVHHTYPDDGTDLGA